MYQGDIYGSDDELITNFIFDNNIINYADFTGNVRFNGGSSNQ